MARLLDGLSHNQRNVLPGVMNLVVAERHALFIANAVGLTSIFLRQRFLRFRRVQVGYYASTPGAACADLLSIERIFPFAILLSTVQP